MLHRLNSALPISPPGPLRMGWWLSVAMFTAWMEPDLLLASRCPLAKKAASGERFVLKPVPRQLAQIDEAEADGFFWFGKRSRKDESAADSRSASSVVKKSKTASFFNRDDDSKDAKKKIVKKKLASTSKKKTTVADAKKTTTKDHYKSCFGNHEKGCEASGSCRQEIQRPVQA